MDLLGLVIIIVFSILSSVSKSNQAKQKHAERQKSDGTMPHHSAGEAAPVPKPMASGRPAPQKKSGNLLESLMEFLEQVDDMLDEDDTNGTSGKKEPAHQKPAHSSGKSAAKQKRKQAVPQSVKKSPAELPKQTLMEQRPDREQREEHKKVTASVKPIAPTVKPLTATVKPLKNAFNNEEHCEHRIELNPNIQYSGQQQQSAVRQAAIVKTDRDSLIQGIVWSEILGKPKAYQRRENRFQRR